MHLVNLNFLTLGSCLSFAMMLTASRGAASNKSHLTPCKGDDDCPKGNCCVSMNFWKNAKSYCAPYLRKGESCIPDETDFKTYNGNYFLACPCEAGLICKPEYYRESIFWGEVAMNETCSAPATTTTSSTTPEAKLEETSEASITTETSS